MQHALNIILWPAGITGLIVGINIAKDRRKDKNDDDRN